MKSNIAHAFHTTQLFLIPRNLSKCGKVSLPYFNKGDNQKTQQTSKENAASRIYVVSSVH